MFPVKRTLIVLITVALSAPSLIYSQSREMGIMLGTMGYRGDLNPTVYDNRYLEPAVGLLYRRSYSNHWCFKAGLNYGHIQASDTQAEDDWSKNRNLNFRSHIIEATGQFEFNFFPYQTASPFSKFSPYLFCGYSLFHFNPKAEINGEWVKLQPLGTEGQGTDQYPDRKKYSRTSLAFTYGGGIKFKIMRRFGLMIESGIRSAYTDYLDDVSSTYADPLAIRREHGKTAMALSDRSLEQVQGGNVGRQRGDRRNRDLYVFTGVQLTYTLSKKYIDSCRPFRIKLW
ncbi:MAG: hypothetical protein RLZZ630_547 [Bacteroidota bacterium]|jgi:hypothetical protein